MSTVKCCISMKKLLQNPLELQKLRKRKIHLLLFDYK